jgi:hypothetical protein
MRTTICHKVRIFLALPQSMTANVLRYARRDQVISVDHPIQTFLASHAVIRFLDASDGAQNAIPAKKRRNDGAWDTEEHAVYIMLGSCNRKSCNLDGINGRHTGIGDAIGDGRRYLWTYCRVAAIMKCDTSISSRSETRADGRSEVASQIPAQ